MLVNCYGINLKMVVKWKRCSFVSDLKMGFKELKFIFLLVEDEVIIVVFCKYMLLLFDDCFYVF